MSRRKLAIVAITTVFTIGIGVLAFVIIDHEKESKTYSAEAFYAYDVTDKRKLVGSAEYVFLGRVIDKSGSVSNETSKPGTVIPQSQFRVDVLQVLKGEVSGRVVVNQQGGYDPEDKSILLMEDDPLLKPGDTYLFATRRNPDKGWLSIIVPGYADIRITSPEQRSRVVKEFAEAVQYQEPQIDRNP